MATRTELLDKAKAAKAAKAAGTVAAFVAASRQQREPNINISSRPQKVEACDLPSAEDHALNVSEMFETLAGRFEFDDGMLREEAETRARSILERPQA